MTQDEQGRKRKLRRLWPALAVLAALLAVLIVPPYVSISRYKSRITQLMSTSLGRPVRLSSVELRLLPRPGFLLTDLTVEEDPAYGAEPALHANTVRASIRLLPLWRGRLEISSVSLDEASLNLVRTTTGPWNLNSVLHTASGPHPGRTLPYLEATNTRINIKNGVEKLPFSLTNTSLSLEQQKDGNWRIRLTGQPARTDLSLETGDTGDVRLDATVRPGSQLRQMPLQLDLEWRKAQLGQLSRLILGSDPGWRGDLTGELHMDGTADMAVIKSRLRATGVHRAEFAPAAPLDFDANCGFVYHYSSRAIETLVCDSPLGDGHIHLAGDLPGTSGLAHLSVELNKIPVAAGLDALRTVRSGLGPGLEAKGTVSGKMNYAEVAPETIVPEKPAHPGKNHPGKTPPAAPGPLTGAFTVEGFQLSGDGLSVPIQIPHLELEPAAVVPGQHLALTATTSLPAGAASPLTITSRLALSGYQLTVRGQASLTRARELAHVAGMAKATALDSLAGDAVTVDLSADGPWLPAPQISSTSMTPANTESGPAAPSAVSNPTTDRLSGTLAFRNVNWKADYLVNHVEISQATLHLEDSGLRWDPVAFSYGPVKGMASLNLPANCGAQPSCTPQFQVQFGVLDSKTLQSAILGAQKPGTVLSTLLARLHPESTPAWPLLEGTVKAETLLLGPVTLREPTATLRIVPTGAEIKGLDAGLLGGRVHGAGTLRIAATAQDKPTYTFEGQVENLSPSAVGLLLDQHWSGGAFDGKCKIELSGYTGKDLTASAKGTLHFDWQRGAVTGVGVPPVLARFDHWTADAEIANGAVTLKQNQIQRGAQNAALVASASLGSSSKTSFTAPPAPQAAKR
jgi:hypothetical protein